MRISDILNAYIFLKEEKHISPKELDNMSDSELIKSAKNNGWNYIDKREDD